MRRARTILLPHHVPWWQTINPIHRVFGFPIYGFLYSPAIVETKFSKTAESCTTQKSRNFNKWWKLMATNKIDATWTTKYCQTASSQETTAIHRSYTKASVASLQISLHGMGSSALTWLGCSKCRFGKWPVTSTTSSSTLMFLVGISIVGWVDRHWRTTDLKFSYLTF